MSRVQGRLVESYTACIQKPTLQNYTRRGADTQRRPGESAVFGHLSFPGARGGGGEPCDESTGLHMLFSVSSALTRHLCSFFSLDAFAGKHVNARNTVVPYNT
jgi:hypothetical protein